MILRRTAICLTIFLFSISALFGLSPLKTVENSNIKVLNIYKKNKRITQRTVEEVFQVISTVSNFRNTAVKISLPYREILTPSEYRRFIEIMERYMILVLKVKLKQRPIVNFEYLGETIDGNRAIVNIRTHYKRKKVKIDYLLEKEEGQWKVFNYRVGDTDSILSYQKQFTKLFKRFSFTKISAKLKVKMTKLKLRLEDSTI